MLLSEIASHVEGQLSGTDVRINAVSIDTRTLVNDDLYVAIKGDFFDGHTFINKAELAGAAALLIEDETSSSLPKITVKDTRLALAEMAGAWKKKANVKTIGITGSNGKTTVKEMIASILSVNSSVLFTQGNLNNDIGVPLTLLKLGQQHEYAVIEMGANHAGEIKYSSHYVKPDVVVITNVGVAHIEGFGDLEGVAKAKGEIIQSLGNKGVVVLNKEDEFYPLWVKLAEQRKVVSFGLDNSGEVNAQAITFSVKNNEFISQFNLVTATDSITINLKLAGQHNVLNALAAATCCLQMDIGLQQIKQGLEKLVPVTGRLQPLVGSLGNLIINDTYNANPNSLKVALDVLVKCEGKHWVVLGALAEMGADSVSIHEELGELMNSMGIERLFAVGFDAEHTVKKFGKGATFFHSQKLLIETLKKEIQGGEALLIKGSRSQQMEKSVAELVTDFRI